MFVCGDYFYGNKISDYGIQCGYVDYATLAKAFDAVMANNFMADTDNACLGYWEQESGFTDESESEYCPEIFQFFIVDDNGAEILKEANEIVFYNETLGLYLWGVTHWGTSWDYVCTDIKIIKDKE